MLPTLAQIRAAAEQVRSVLPPTPQIMWPLLSERTGAEVWVKHENCHPVGAFKVRGGLVYLNQLTESGDSPAAVITATRGNHGQSIAFAARRKGIRCIVVVPHGNSVEKNAAMRSWGAELIEHGRDFNDAIDHARQVAEEQGAHFVSSFNAHLVRGVATYWLEFFTAAPELETVFVPIGLGSGICGAVAVRDGLGLSTRVVGVVSSEAPAYAESLRTGNLEERPPRTRLADGIAVRRPDAEALEIIRKHVDDVVQVTDGEVAAAMRHFFTDTHHVAEGAAAAPLAALLQGGARYRGKRVGLVLTGSNIDHDLFANVLGDSTWDQ